jgi:hypothetical protein
LCIGQASFDHRLHKVGLIVDHHFSLITAAAASTQPLLQMMISYITAGVVAAAVIILLEMLLIQLLLLQPPLHCFLMDLTMQLVTLVCATHTWPEIFPCYIMLAHHNIIVIAAHYILPTFLPLPLPHHESSPISLQLMYKKT